MVGHLDAVFFLCWCLIVLRFVYGDNPSSEGAIAHQFERSYIWKAATTR